MLYGIEATYQASPFRGGGPDWPGEFTG